MFVILTPALACPSLAKEGESIDVLLLAKKRQIHDDLFNMTYSSWKHNKEKTIDRNDVEIVSDAPSDYHISEYVESLYAERGFTKQVKARITISEKKGLYQLNSPFPDDITSIIAALEPPSFAHDAVVRHHPFYIGDGDYLNIGHISDSHLAARMDMLEERWSKNFKDAWHKSSLSGGKPGDFSNYNNQFEHILKALNKDKTVDVIIHTAAPVKDEHNRKRNPAVRDRIDGNRGIVFRNGKIPYLKIKYGSIILIGDFKEYFNIRSAYRLHIGNGTNDTGNA